MQQWIQQVESGVELTEAQVVEVVDALVADEVSVEHKGMFLTALARKGETVAEIAAFVKALCDKSIRPRLDPRVSSGIVIDVCGTGGDHFNTFNISTTVAIIVAAAGVPVAKHGNRAVTSQSGSADVLEALGIRTDLSPEEVGQWLVRHNFAFLFAPLFHPAFKNIAPARKWCAQKGQRTVFNYLGPLLNPVRPALQLIGVPNPKMCEPIAQVLQLIGVRRAMVVSGQVGDRFLDELSILGDNTIAEFQKERGIQLTNVPLRELNIPPADLGSLTGGDKVVNAGIIRAILAGQETGAKRNAVLLNAGAALCVAGMAQTLTQGWDLAAELIDSGRATAKLEELAAASSAHE